MSRLLALTPARIVVVLALVVHLILRLRLALGPLEHIDGVTIPDDTYLSLNVARNIASGLGPLYGLAPTNGIQPLYVFLAAPLFWLFDDPLRPVHGALVLLTLCDAAAHALLYGWLIRLGVGVAGLVAVAACTVLNPYGIETALNGLETSLSFLLLMATFRHADRILGGEVVAPRPRQSLLLGALLGLALFARIDAVFVGPVLLLVLVYRVMRGRARVVRWGQPLLLLLAGGTLTYAPWLIYSQVHTGAVYPVSGRAVRHMTLLDVDHMPTFENFYGGFLLNAVQVLWHHQGLLLALAGAALLAVFLVGVRSGEPTWRTRFGPAAAPAVFGLVLVLAYALVIFAPWYWKRYFYPAILPSLLVLGIAVDLLVRRMRGGTAAALTVALVTVAVYFSVTAHQFQTIHTAKDWKFGYMQIGRYAKENLPAGTRVGATQSGGLGYFADTLTVVNLDGVVNAECFADLQQGRVMDYIRRVGVRYVVGWPENFVFLFKNQTDPPLRPQVDLVFDRDTGVSSLDKRWYLYRVGDG